MSCSGALGVPDCIFLVLVLDFLLTAARMCAHLYLWHRCVLDALLGYTH